MRTHIFRVVLLSALLSLNSFGQSYKLTDLGVQIGANSYAQSINNQGQVVGYWDTTNGAHAFLYQNGAVTDLGLLGLGVTNDNYALSINNLGQVVGFSETTNGSRAFLYQNGAITNLGNMGGLGSYAYGVNGSGQIVGYVDTTNGAGAILYGNGAIINIGTLGGTNSFAYGINNSLQVAGSSLLTDNATMHAFLWQNGLINDLNQFQTINNGWQLTDAHGINDLGNIVGWGAINGQEHAFLFSSSGVATDLGVLAGGTNSYALGLNNSKQVVGASSSSAGNHAVFWQDGVANDLNGLINASGWELKEACGINDLGQIVGWGVFNGQARAFLLTYKNNTAETKGSVARSNQTVGLSQILPPSGSLTILITSPVTNAFFSTPTNLTINATTTDSGGTVTQVLFYVGGTKLLGIATSSPYSMIWSNPAVGIHALTAVALDNAAQVATSSVVNVSISTNLSPVADAHVRDGSSTNLNFGTTNVMQCLTTTTNGNNRDIYFKFDLTGMSNVSSAQLKIFGWITSTNSITNMVYSVTNTSWTETGITWSNKPSRVGALFTNKVTGTNWISYDISTYVNAQLAVGQSIVSVALHDPTNYTLLLSVNSKENTTNKPVLVIVTTNSPLSVSITNPANNSVFIPGSNISLGASASDTDGTISQVQFYFGTNLLGTATSLPFTAIWTNPAVGIYSVTAKATDNNGLTKVSSAIAIYVTPLTNMAAWWRAEGNALDSVGTNNGTLQGGASYTNGEVGQAFSFDGSSGYVEVGDISDLNMSNTFSFEGWIYPTGPGSGGSGTGGILVCKEDEYEVTRFSDGSIQWAFANSSPGWAWINSGAIAPLNQWSHVAVTYSNGIVNTYLNGILANIYNGTGSIGSVGTPNDFRIGGRTLYTQFFQGNIDEVSIYSRALSANEIAAIYNAGSAGKIPGYSVTLTNPVNNAAIVAGSNISLGASASDQNGTVTQVQFFQGTNSLGLVTTAPFAMVWTNPPSGTYVLSARASDSAGLFSTSSVVNVTVDVPPSVTLTNPANNAVVAAGANISLVATASDADGTIAQVQFFQGTNSLGIGTNSPYNQVWNNVASGTYALSAVATDNSGLSTTSSTVIMTVEIPPVVSITAPPNNSVLISTLTNVTLSATASDADGSVAWVQFFQGATSLGIVTNAPYSLIWSNVIPGSYSLTAVAVDNLGLATVSPVVSIIVTPFSIVITNPINNAIYAAGLTNISLNVMASDVLGIVTQVQYFQGSTSLGIATNPPFNLIWSNAPTGIFGISAIATDNKDYTATSSVVNIVIAPLFITNSMTLWLKADAISGLANNAPVGTWLDSSGWANNATQANSGNQPLYVTNILNGYPVLRFNGGSTYFNLPNVLNGATGAEAFVVLKAANNTPGKNAALWRMGGEYPNGIPGYPTSNGQIGEDFGTANPPFNQPYQLGTPSQPLTQFNVYEVSAQTGNWVTWINGILLYQVTNNVFGSYSTSQLGRDPVWSPGGSAGYFGGDIAEVLIFNRPLTTSERVAVSGYLNGKYALVPSVPATPTNLVATAISPTQIGLTWGEVLNAGATQIAIKRSTTSNGVYQTVAQITDATSYVDANLTAGTTYYYQVQAINVARWSPTSNGTQATTLAAGADAPFGSLAMWLKADAGLEQSSTNTPVNLWVDQSVNGNNATQPTGGIQPVWVPKVIGDRPVVRFDGRTTYFNLPNILNGTTGAEAFVVLKAATNMPANPAVLWRMGYNNSDTTLGYPHNDGHIDEDFGTYGHYDFGVTAQSVMQYNVYEVTAQTGNWAAWLNGIILFQATNNAYLTNGAPQLGRDSSWYNNGYYFAGDVAEVMVFNRALATSERIAVGNYLNQKYTLVNSTNMPTAPMALTATVASPNQINLAWSNTSITLAEIQIERKTDIDGTYSVITEVGIGVTSYVDLGLISGHQYFYRIRASNLASYSPYSNEASAIINTLPTVILSSPANGALFVDPANVSLTAIAADSDGSIVKVEFFSGATNKLGEIDNAPFNFTWSNVLSGSYTLTARVTDNLGAVTNSAPVSITVSNPPPSVSLIAPTNNQLYLTPAIITVTANASDTNGIINKVDFFYNSTNKIGTVTSSPYTVIWTNLTSGNYPLTAVATDNEGVTSTSTSVSVIISNPPPTVALITPTNNQFYFAPAIINLQATATDINGTISKVDFFYNSTNKIGTVTTGSNPYTLNWTNLTTGIYPLTAVATDNGGATSTSIVVNVTVSNTPPTISIASPTNNALFQAPASISMAANASDVNGFVAKVEYFYAATNKIGESTVSPFMVVWNNILAGTNFITAKATDDGGATAISSLVKVIINTQPVVSITNPVSNASFPAPTNLTIKATASDSDGTISRVDFYYGINNFIGSDTNAPYSIVLTNAPFGTYPLTAKATDNRGGTSTSSPVYVSVSSNLTDMADSYVRDGTFANTNFGTATTLLVQTNATSGSKYDTYFKFDTSKFANVTAARLNFFASVSAKNNTLGVTVCGTGTNWTETGITWSNRPALGTVIQATNISGTSSVWYILDVTGYVQSQRAAGTNVISLALHATNTTSANVIINSKEAGSNVPYLQIFATNTPPVVSITNPVNHATFTPSNNITISANASDGDGSIYQVEFFRGSTSLGIRTNAPYSLTWTNVPFGEYVLTAVATDNLGTKTTSSVVNLNADSASNGLDPDGDGLSNIEEWLLGTDPTVSDAASIGTGTIKIHTPLE